MHKHLIFGAIAVFVLATGANTIPAAAAETFDAANATYEFAGDTFTLADGEAQIMGHSSLPDTPDTPVPVGYTLAKSASGKLAGGSSGEAVALYRGFGANLRWVTLFAFEEKDGKFVQTAASAVYQEDAGVESLSVDDDTISVDLLVVSDADKQLPHYQQKPTQPLTLTFKIEDGAFVQVP